MWGQVLQSSILPSRQERLGDGGSLPRRGAFIPRMACLRLVCNEYLAGSAVHLKKMCDCKT